MFDTNQAAYVKLRNLLKERTASVVAWVGAGLSVPAEAPSWLGLRKLLCAAFRERIDATDGDENKKKLQTILNQAQNTRELWLAFEMLENHLGVAYRETIRGAFANVAAARVPQAYVDLWTLGIRGMITLNIDRLAARGFAEAHGPSGAR